jgi:acyl-CoA dehydrogenase
MARAALVAQARLAENADGADFYRTKIVTARFYAEHILPQAQGLAYTVVNGAQSALDLAEDQF